MDTAVRSYTAASRKKSASGFGSPSKFCDESRSYRTWSAAFLFAPPVLAARTGRREPCRFSSELPGLPTRSSCRHRLEAVAAVVAKPKFWEAIHG